MERRTSSGVSSVFIIFGYVFLPLLVNLSIIIFLALSFNFAEPISSNRNIIAISAVAWLYIGLAVLVFIFGKQMRIWSIFKSESCGIFLSILIIIFYPLYFLLTLPMTIFHVFRFLGSPAQVWDRMFGNTCMSLDHMSYERTGSYSKVVLCFFTIGPLFALFTIIYVLLVIVMFPFYYYFFSPFGFGPYGMNLFLSMRHLDEFQEFSWDCTERTFMWCVLIYSWFIAFPAILFAVFYMVFVSLVAWHAILLLVVAGLYFLFFAFYSSFIICCSRWVRQIV
ncbi:hypothetical protein TRFO_22181 [Tritrichomonas foetus]|uniref:Transmembrane protein n=1 Tax=Tritrichomonas foetus TaxID=1144522 RepID=A0A1J4KC87_9EUKA|nr:hypothetical protein TRFO_22181 [Tritrichomonas foetus]|eukprot:OHT09031.1 hypothetical protein TRFO_22181 [Tritrichomonas foetus]